MTLRHYQTAACDAVARAWEEQRSTLLCLATGTGKTVTAAEILHRRAEHGRILWLAHRTELLDQAKRTIQGRTGLACEVEQAENRATVGADLWGACPVVVASVQTLRGPRLRRWPSDAFATIVIDEAHHAAATGYRAILSRFSSARVLGLTATPDRSDGVGLGSVFGGIAYEYGILDGIRDGYLTDIRQMAVECADLDLRDVKTVAGDLAQGELERRLQLDAVLHQMAAPIVREAGRRQTLIFTAGVAQAHALVAVLGGYTDQRRVAAIDGKTPAEIRQERLDRFRAGELQFLVNCAVLTEGTDLPMASCVAMCRPTKSRSLYAQIVGRGLRPAPGVVDGLATAEERRAAIAASSMPDCLVLDFKDNAGRHDLVTPLDVLAGKPVPSDIARRVAELRETMPTEAALAKAEQEAIERERRAEQARIREAKIRADVQYRAREVSAFSLPGVSLGQEQGPRATQGQLDYLRKMGVDVSTVPSRREASKALDALTARRRRGLCSYKQAKILAKYGLPTDLPFAAASEAITAIAQNGWRVPRGLVVEAAE